MSIQALLLPVIHEFAQILIFIKPIKNIQYKSGVSMFSANNYSIIIILGIVSFVLSFFGASVGLMLGQIRLPLIVYALQSTANGIGIATGTNLATAAMGACAGTYYHIKEGRVNYRVVCAIGIPSAIGAIISVLAFARIQADWIKIVIGIVLIYSSFQIANPKKPNQGEDKLSTHQRFLIEIGIGVGLGLLAGIVGLGLASIRLPAMIRVLGMEPKEAVGTNLAINFLTLATGGTASMLTLGVHWPLLLSLVPTTLLGSYIGAKTLKKIESSNLRKLIAWVLGGTGAFMIAESMH